MSSVYNSDFTNAPKDRMILVNHPDWSCPAFMKYQYYSEEEGGPVFEFIEELISDHDFGITFTELSQPHSYVWAEVPK